MSSIIRTENADKLGWAEPHSRFPLSFPLISPLSTFNILKSSSIGCRLHFKQFLMFRPVSYVVYTFRKVQSVVAEILLLMIEFIFHWMLSSYKETFNFDLVPKASFQNLKIWSGGCLDISLLIFRGRLPSEVLLISSNFSFWFGPLS